MKEVMRVGIFSPLLIELFHNEVIYYNINNFLRLLKVYNEEIQSAKRW